jgi:hypothetical protein
MTAPERASAPVRIMYKPWGVIAGVAGGMVAGAVFKQIWRLVRGEEAPGATDPARSWTETALAAALEGAVFAGVKALVDRGAASSFAKATGTGRPDPLGCADLGGCCRQEFEHPCPVQLSWPLCLILCLILMEQQNVLGGSVDRFGVPAFGDEWTWV